MAMDRLHGGDHEAAAPLWEKFFAWARRVKGWWVNCHD